MKKLICAPMATLSHEAFRRTVERFGGCDEYFTEMINASSLIHMGPFERYYLLSGPVPQKIVWQLTGWNAQDMAQAAQILCAQGGIGIDLNMGCSAPQIYKTGAGIAWMLKDQCETRKCVQLVKSTLNEYEDKTAVHMRLSVKCRLGAQDFTDESFFGFTDMLCEEGVEMITLHPRTIKEKYRGLPRYEYVQRLCERYKDKMKIVLNGAIKDGASADYALSQCPDADGIMIARAAAQKPWIFDELKNGGKKDRQVDLMTVAIDFIDDVVRYQPPEFHRTRIQRFFSYYCDNFKFGHYFKTNMLNYKGIEESKATVRDYFEKQAEERWLTY